MKKGCEKCDYTGFSYGKIPCVCIEKAKMNPYSLQGIPPETGKGVEHDLKTFTIDCSIVPGDKVYYYGHNLYGIKHFMGTVLRVDNDGTYTILLDE